MIRKTFYTSSLEDTMTWVFLPCNLEDATMEGLVELYESGNNPHIEDLPANFVALDV